MVPKFRAWDKGLEFMMPVESIDFEYGMINVNAAWRTFEEIELMQSTGLKDKNGVEIFEGDIVIRANEAIGYVAYLQQEAGFVVVTKKSDYRLGHRNTGETYDVATAHEVIGNICSKPKLWEQADEN